jgi:hypothetical protein
MKTFNDLKFKPHRNGQRGSVHAQMDLGNGYVLSVVAGEGNRMGNNSQIGHGLYNDEGTYEIAVFENGEFTKISSSDDVLGWQSPEEIDVLIEEIVSTPDKFKERTIQNQKEHDELWK